MFIERALRDSPSSGGAEGGGSRIFISGNIALLWGASIGMTARVHKHLAPLEPECYLVLLRFTRRRSWAEQLAAV